MKELSEKLTARLNTAEREEVKILETAMERTRGDYEANPTAANKKHWDAARQGLVDEIERLEEKYFNRQPAFDNVAEVFKWLKSEKYKAGRSKVYNDAKIGMLNVQEDGSVLVADVKAYATTLSKKESRTGDLDPEYKKKTAAERFQLELKNQKLQFELERERGKYVLKSDVQTELAVKIGLLEALIKNMMRHKLDHWLSIAKNKPRVFYALFEAEFDRLFDELGNADEIGIVVKKQEPEQLGGEAVN